MASTCFCGCGRQVPFRPKLRAANGMGAQMARDVRLFAGALERDQNEPATETELRTLVEEGGFHRDELRDVLHGLRDKTTAGREGRKGWLALAAKHRERLWRQVAGAGYPGLNAAKDADLVYAGAVASARVVTCEATGTAVNDDPKLRVRLRVAPPGEEPFDVEKALLVSRLAIPRMGETVTVHYDPADHERFTFRRDDLVDDMLGPAPTPDPPAPDRVEQLEGLARLRDAGDLTDEEFEAEKRRVLDP